MSDLVDAVSVSSVVDDAQLQLDAVSGAWTLMPLTLESTQVALDAVRYQPNYARTVTIRLCLHFINTIRKRVSRTSITSYLFFVDGCEISQVEPSGRCDIDYCRPYTYELQLAQKAKGSDAFIVQSIFKKVDQKMLDMEEALVHTKLPDVWSTVGDNRHKHQITDKQPITWTSDVWPIEVTARPLSLHTESTLSPSEKIPTFDSDTVIAIIGIAMVSIYSIAFVMALVMVRWRALENATQETLDEEHAPLSGLNTADTMKSIITMDSISTNTTLVVERDTGFLI